jgi:hypothetical protein
VQVLDRTQFGINPQFLRDKSDHAFKIRVASVVLLPVDQDIARIGLQQAGDHRHRRAFAGAIGAQQAQHLTRLQRKADIGHGLVIAESPREMADFQQFRIRDGTGTHDSFCSLTAHAY